MSFESDIKEFVEQYYFDNGIAPTIREISEGIGLAKSSVHRYLKKMNDSGKIEYLGRRNIRTDNIKSVNGDQVLVRKVGTVKCGPLSFAEQEITDCFTLPKSLIGEGEFFMLEASGTSMVNSGINDGDLVLIRKQNYAEVGQVVVALYEDETTLKRFYKDDKNQRFILHPENEEMEDIIVEGNLQIQGVAVRVLKEVI